MDVGWVGVRLGVGVEVMTGVDVRAAVPVGITKKSGKPNEQPVRKTIAKMEITNCFTPCLIALPLPRSPRRILGPR